MADSKDKVTDLVEALMNARAAAQARAEPANALVKLLSAEPYAYVDRWFFKQTFTVDGYRFVRSRFENCELHTSKATFSFEACHFTGCTFVFYSEALKAVKLSDYLTLPLPPSMRAIVDADGRITIQ